MRPGELVFFTVVSCSFLRFEDNDGVSRIDLQRLTHSGQGVITLEVVVVLMGKVCTLVVQWDMWRSGQ